MTTKRRAPLDPEIEAMELCLAVLDGLGGDACVRVTAWLADWARRKPPPTIDPDAPREEAAAK